MRQASTTPVAGHSGFGVLAGLETPRRGVMTRRIIVLSH